MDDDEHLVEADRLISIGDPRGDLIVMQHRYETKPTPELAAAITAHIEQHAEALLGPMQGMAVTWRRGYVDSIVIDDTPPPEMPDGYEAGEDFWRRYGYTNALGTGLIPLGDLTGEKEFVDACLAHPSARLTKLTLDPVASEVAIHALGKLETLESLTIGLIDYREASRVLGAITKHPRLRSLDFGVAQFARLMGRGALAETAEQGPWVEDDSIARMAKLEDLTLRGWSLFASLRHPTLRRLELHGDVVDDLQRFPRLVRLAHVAYEDEYRPTPVEIELNRDAFPMLRELVFRGQYDEDAAQTTLFNQLAESDILPQLSELELPYLRSMYDDLAFARRFRHLARFCVGELIDDDDPSLDGEEPEQLEPFETRVRRELPDLVIG